MSQGEFRHHLNPEFGLSEHLHGEDVHRSESREHVRHSEGFRVALINNVCASKLSELTHGGIGGNLSIDVDSEREPEPRKFRNENADPRTVPDTAETAP